MHETRHVLWLLESVVSKQLWHVCFVSAVTDFDIVGDSCTGLSSFVFVVVLQLVSVGHRLVQCARVCMGARGAGKQVGRHVVGQLVMQWQV